MAMGVKVDRTIEGETAEGSPTLSSCSWASIGTAFVTALARPLRSSSSKRAESGVRRGLLSSLALQLCPFGLGRGSASASFQTKRL